MIYRIKRLTGFNPIFLLFYQKEKSGVFVYLLLLLKSFYFGILIALLILIKP